MVSKPDSSAKHSGTRRSLLESLDDGGAERWEIGRRPAGDQIAIDDYLLVDDFAASISQVGADARIRRHCSPRHRIRLHKGPGPMADGGDGFTGIHEVPHERHRRTIQSKLVRIHCAPGRTRASNSSTDASDTARSTRNVPAGSKSWLRACMSSVFSDSSWTWAPFSVSTERGSSSSTFSTPSAAKIATCLPCNVFDI